MAYPENKETDKEASIERPEELGTASEDNTHLQQQVPKHAARRASREIARETNPVLSPATKHLPRDSGPSPLRMDVLHVASDIAGKQAAGKSRTRRSYFSVNDVQYLRIGALGRGGSSRVYRVIDKNDHVFALKRVNINNVDETTLRGYKSEIDLLKRLAGVRRVVNLRDWELDSRKQILSLVSINISCVISTLLT